MRARRCGPRVLKTIARSGIRGRLSGLSSGTQCVASGRSPVCASAGVSKACRRGLQGLSERPCQCSWEAEHNAAESAEVCRCAHVAWRQDPTAADVQAPSHTMTYRGDAAQLLAPRANARWLYLASLFERTCLPVAALPKFAKRCHASSMSTMNLSLPDSLKDFVDEQVNQGGYGTSSEYVRELIRKDQDRLRLRALLLTGASSPQSKPVDDAYFDSLRLQANAAKRGAIPALMREPDLI
jgi:antitoxin ParD1/3/4